jgi:hypothetical protein
MHQLTRLPSHPFPILDLLFRCIMLRSLRLSPAPLPPTRSHTPSLSFSCSIPLAIPPRANSFFLCLFLILHAVLHITIGRNAKYDCVRSSSVSSRWSHSFRRRNRFSTNCCLIAVRYATNEKKKVSAKKVYVHICIFMDNDEKDNQIIK